MIKANGEMQMKERKTREIREQEQEKRGLEKQDMEKRQQEKPEGEKRQREKPRQEKGRREKSRQEKGKRERRMKQGGERQARWFWNRNHGTGRGSRFSWRSRLMGMILLVALLLFSLSFISSYEIFIKKLEETNLKSTRIAFEQTQTNLDNKLSQAEESANRLLAREVTLDFLAHEQRNLPEVSLATKQAADAMYACIGSNPDLAGIALIDGEGRGLGVTSWSRTAISHLKQDDQAYQLLQKSDSRYPYYKWFGAGEARKYFVGVPGFSDFFENRNGDPVQMLVGVRLISYGKEAKDSAYLLLTVKDAAVQACYSQFLYSQNTMTLLDQEGMVISSMDGRELDKRPVYDEKLHQEEGMGSFSYRKKNGEDFQMIYSALPQYDWTLINEIPKSSYRKQAHDLKFLLLFLWIFTLSLMLLFFVIWLGKYTRPVERIILSMKRVQGGDLSPVHFPASGIREMDELGEQFGTTVSTIDTLISRVRSMDEENTKEELRTLQYQINPHFLYNSLSSIRWMAILNNNPKIADALLLLAKIIEPILRSPSFYWTVGEELEFLNSYVRMLTLRFGGGLVYDAACAPDLKGLSFPRFTLQPILENCFTHGMIPGDTLHIRVNLTRSEGRLCVEVVNTGSHIRPEKLDRLNRLLERRAEPEASSESIGLLNVNKRLFLLYGMKANMSIRSDEETDTTVVLQIPDGG